MFLLRRPGTAEIEAFLAASPQLPLSYAPVGLARAGASGFTDDRMRVVIGRGAVAFGRAVKALSEWRQFRLGWTEVHPAGAPTVPGTDVAVLIRHLGFYSLNGARVVYSIGGPGGSEFGYAYGTLPTHAEAGEEIFRVALDERTGDVIYEIRAGSRPCATLARIGQPVVRVLQAKFRRDSARAMLAAVSD